MHRLKLDIAYRFREGLRLSQWNDVLETIKQYQEVRTSLSSAYMDGAMEIQGFANERGSVAFPLGAEAGEITKLSDRARAVILYFLRVKEDKNHAGESLLQSHPGRLGKS